jgi:hypothetical protein
VWSILAVRPVQGKERRMKGNARKNRLRKGRIIMKEERKEEAKIKEGEKRGK